jgi:hypothetical protein
MIAGGAVAARARAVPVSALLPLAALATALGCEGM